MSGPRGAETMSRPSHPGGPPAHPSTPRTLAHVCHPLQLSGLMCPLQSKISGMDTTAAPRGPRPSCTVVPPSTPWAHCWHGQEPPAPSTAWGPGAEREAAAGQPRSRPGLCSGGGQLPRRAAARWPRRPRRSGATEPRPPPRQRGLDFTTTASVRLGEQGPLSRGDDFSENLELGGGRGLFTACVEVQSPPDAESPRGTG